MAEGNSVKSDTWKLWERSGKNDLWVLISLFKCGPAYSANFLHKFRSIFYIRLANISISKTQLGGMLTQLTFIMCRVVSNTIQTFSVCWICVPLPCWKYLQLLCVFIFGIMLNLRSLEVLFYKWSERHSIGGCSDDVLHLFFFLAWSMSSRLRRTTTARSSAMVKNEILYFVLFTICCRLGFVVKSKRIWCWVHLVTFR